MNNRLAAAICCALLTLTGCASSDVVLSRTGGISGGQVGVSVSTDATATITRPSGVVVEALSADEIALLQAALASAKQGNVQWVATAAPDAYQYMLSADGTTWRWTDADEPANLTPARELLDALLEQ